MSIIETFELTKQFGERSAVKDLSIAIPEGSVFGFLGPNGAGKTTTVRMLSALIAPTAGTATVAGFKLGQEDKEIRKRVGILTETPGLYGKMTALQNLVFFALLYEVEEERARSQAMKYLTMLDLAARADDRVASFSKGMRQKVAIARALIHEPPVVFLDEPTAGLDPEAARTVRDFIKELRQEGRTIFITTHNLPEADELCDLIGVFRTTLLRVDTPANLRRSLFGTGTLVKLADDPARWTTFAAGLPFVKEVQVHDGALAVRLDDPDERNPLLVQALVGAGAPIRYIEAMDYSLEQVYLELIDESKAGAA